MKIRKIGLLTTAAVGVAMVSSLFIGASSVSARSFGPVYRGGIARVWYKDAEDLFCVQSLAPYGMTFGLYPSNKRRGPSYQVSIDGFRETKCVSLARAYEDTRYNYWVANTDFIDQNGTGWFYS